MVVDHLDPATVRQAGFDHDEHVAARRVFSSTRAGRNPGPLHRRGEPDCRE